MGSKEQPMELIGANGFLHSWDVLRRRALFIGTCMCGIQAKLRSSWSSDKSVKPKKIVKDAYVDERIWTGSHMMDTTTEKILNRELYIGVLSTKPFDPGGLLCVKVHLVWSESNGENDRILKIGKMFFPCVTDSQGWRRKTGKLNLCSPVSMETWIHGEIGEGEKTCRVIRVVYLGDQNRIREG